MPRAPAVLSRRFARAALPLVLAVAGTASGKEPHVEKCPGGVIVVVGGDPSDYEGDPLGQFFDGEPTGGAGFLDTSGGDGPAIAEAFGFRVSFLFGGACVADPADADCPWAWFFLVSAINGADPYADAEPDWLLRAPEGSQFNGFVLPSSFGRGQAQFQRQSALTSIRARPAHRLEDGRGMTIAVLDTGVDDSHPMLDGRVDVERGFDFVDADASAREEELDGSGSAGRGYGHGTTVAGLALAAAPAARILPVRVLDRDAVGTTARLAAGIRWAVARDADVVNMSLGGGAPSDLVSRAIAEGRDRGVLFVAAAGNRDPFATDFPASDENVVAVSGFGGSPGDVSAPSMNVVGPHPGRHWFKGTGTSFAAPLVAGGFALTLRRHPDLDEFSFLQSIGLGKSGKPRLDLVRFAQ